MSGKCWFCRPVVVTRGGGEHTGLDAFMRCTKCGWRTVNHIECNSVSPTVAKVLRREWRYGEKEPTP
jgi:hypothetical protein